MLYSSFATNDMIIKGVYGGGGGYLFKHYRWPSLVAGSGKTTYVTNMADLLRGLGRKVAIINLDPANEKVGYTADIEVSLDLK